MKKLMIAAMMLLCVTSAFAGASDALKAIKKAKTYAEAESLLKQNFNGLADNAEKAEAYNIRRLGSGLLQCPDYSHGVQRTGCKGWTGAHSC